MIDLDRVFEAETAASLDDLISRDVCCKLATGVLECPRIRRLLFDTVRRPIVSSKEGSPTDN